ncbi:TIGR02285 family protein [Pseudomonas sp. LB3P81]
MKTELFKLKRLLSTSLHHSRVWRVAAACALLAGPVSPVWAQPKETLIWLLRDLPPTIIFEGPKKDQGIIDQMLPQLIAGMPQYQHTLMRVNRARALQMLHEEPFTCDPSLLKTKEREQWISFSVPAFRAVSNGLVVRQGDRPVLEPFLIEGEVDLAALLKSSSNKVGVVAERSYGEVVDALLRQAPEGALTPHYGTDALGSLLQMQRLGRLQVVLGYWPEIRYQASQKLITDDQLEFYPIKGTGKYLSGHIGCSDTPQGRQATSEINQLLRNLSRDHLDSLYADWLDPARGSDYLKETKAFFEHQAGQ